MLRSSLVAVGVALVCGVASAQSVSSNIYPIQAPPQFGGVYDINTGRFMGMKHPQGLNANLQTVYNNTCTWSGAGYYVGVAACEDDFDEGRVPLVAGSLAAGPDNAIDSFQIGYCTFFPLGQVSIDVELYDTNALGGGCFQFGPAVDHNILGTGPHGTPDGILTTVGSGIQWPGNNSATPGPQRCWTVTLFAVTPACMATGATTSDLFNWGIRFNQQFNANSPEGPIMSHNGSAGGQGTYNIPPTTDVLYGNPCGDGLDSFDAFWANYDNTNQTATTTACGVPFTGFAGTGCYYFGGYPSNPFASFWFVLTSRGACNCVTTTSAYCTAKTNSNGCTPSMAFTGPNTVSIANATAGLPGNFTASNMSPRPGAAAHLGQLFYSTTGPAASAFLNGHLCTKGPIKRIAPLVNTGGTVGSTVLCDSSVTQDFNARIKSGVDPALTGGANVWIQGWARDAGAFPFNGVQTSNALAFQICP